MSSNTDPIGTRLRLAGSITAPSKHGKCVLYSMSRDQRLQANPALLAAQSYALKEGLPLKIVFFLHERAGQRAKEHYQFMLDGLVLLAKNAKDLNISFSIEHIDTTEAVLAAAQPSSIFCDFSPLRAAQKQLKRIVDISNCPVYEVDAHNVVPVWQASQKQEYAARTIRPKIHRLLSDYLNELPSLQSHPFGTAESNINAELIEKVLMLRPANGQTLQWTAGEVAAQKALQDFIKHRLAAYHLRRNDPSQNGLSGLSPYLHYGQLSSLQVVLAALATLGQSQATDTLIEEIIIRKELSDNFCYYNAHYASLAGAPRWAVQTLDEHRGDKREFIYSKEQLERAETHDDAWNASQRQLVRTGKMHGYMRMYWAKKVLEWSGSPEEAHRTLVYLNDFYSIDGGDPNGYVGILWSVAGLHDRPWFERPIFGTVRYMNANGLKKKFDLEKYIDSFSTTA